MNLLQIDIKWPELKALHEVFLKGRTGAILLKNPYFERLRSQRRLLKFNSNNRSVIEGSSGFKDFYREHFLPAYDRYQYFFNETGVAADGRRPYSLYDLETLIYIHQHRDILKENLTTLRTFSAQMFKGSKYLENNVSIWKAVLTILEITGFPENDPKEQQWRLIIDCLEPRCILLCENLAALKYPHDAIKMNIELWYVGGNNTRILENLSPDKLRLPFYYMCDWDYDGLRIFSNVKAIIEGKGAAVTLLTPHDTSKSLPVDSPYHNSRWKHDRVFTGLNKGLFNEVQQRLITQLVAENSWIEEESQDLKALLLHNNAISHVEA